MSPCGPTFNRRRRPGFPSLILLPRGSTPAHNPYDVAVPAPAGPRLPRPALLAIAAPAEARAAFKALAHDPALPDRPWLRHELPGGLAVVVTGIGKANAAAAVARCIRPGVDRAVLSLGVAGALPASNLRPGDAIVGTDSLFADEGLQTSDGFVDCGAMGFPLAPAPWSGPGVPADPTLLARLRDIAPSAGRIATVSTCSGTDALAAQVAARTGARAEAMEGAAVGLVAARLGVPFAEVRTISNLTGGRSRQGWDLPAALAELARVIGLL